MYAGCFNNQYRNCYIKDTIDKLEEKIKVSGFLQNKRNHGGILFIDLRDHTGILQIVCGENHALAKIPNESVISVEGVIRKREEDQVNLGLPTGQIELVCSHFVIWSSSSPLPIEIDNEKISEELKLKYRTLYLRGQKMKNNLQFRAKVIQFIRNHMICHNFLEVQTPLITSSSPEGARDFVIPSRLHPGKFYALPQAPQLFKQLLMTSGVDRYFQIAPCFRDEDARRDRCYGEFYQLDVEMSFVDQQNVLDILSEIVVDLIRTFNGCEAKLSRLSYKESMKTFGTDKPDLRNPLFIEDFSEIFAASEMDLFKKKVLDGCVVYGIRVPENFGKITATNSLCKNVLEQIEKEHGFKMAYIIKQEEENKGPIAKFFPESETKNNEAIFFICDKEEVCVKKLDILRNYLPKILEFPLDPKDFQLIEIIDFPMFERDDTSPTGWGFKHNPFSMPKNFSDDLGSVEAHQYDLVLNGVEICSGSIRNTNVDLLIKCFEKTGTTANEVRERFNSMISGFSYGVPPHGGFAVGIDRLIMILLNEDNVREVVAFPLNTNGTDPLTKTPSEISLIQKKELHIKP